MIRYMLDTNACIGIINGNPPSLRQHLLQISPNEIAISQIVRYELEFGVCNSRQPQKNRANLANFLKHIRVLDFGNDQSIMAAQIRCDLLRSGQPIGHHDTLIAAHARSLEAILVTHNTREFQRVNALPLEDWEQ
ncbi:MAG: type II toxin-antitoxin system VapC family toxin [Magnetococcus sp. DMHC-1]|nr:type II toxin-antitoxin system VapC family toxin [Magnetococcales bacterium]